ncbi:MAG: DUF2911 domain-containing protein [Hymenobacter sp.]
MKGRADFRHGWCRYGKRWRTGANATTSIKFSDDVTIEGKKVPARRVRHLHHSTQRRSGLVVLNKSTQARRRRGRLQGRPGRGPLHRQALQAAQPRWKPSPLTSPTSPRPRPTWTMSGT